ncbi:MAG: tRNA (N6-threonylcarbamoyladenosine(37)-N6)-methyltransferase TrmO [Anaerolineae bacterium]
MDKRNPFAPEPIVMVPIGYVRREAAQPTGAEAIPKLRSETVRIVVHPAYADALLGVKPGSDLVILSFFHRASRDVLQVHPRGDLDRPLRGVFATRSPARPNPIGLTTVRVVAVEENVLTVLGLDALDGSPVLDMKSYSEGFDTPYSGPEELE